MPATEPKHGSAAASQSLPTVQHSSAEPSWRNVRYVAYRSPFDVYPLRRERPISASETDLSPAAICATDRSALAEEVTRPETSGAVLALHLRTWLFVRRRALSADIKYCRYEVLGACNDDACKDLHARMLVPSDADAIALIQDRYRLPPTTKPARIELFNRGLQLIVDRHRPSLSSATDSSSSSTIGSNPTATPSKAVLDMIGDAARFYEAEVARL